MNGVDQICVVWERNDNMHHNSHQHFLPHWACMCMPAGGGGVSLRECGVVGRRVWVIGRRVGDRKGVWVVGRECGW